MDTLSVRQIGKPVNYIRCDILTGGDQSICGGILKRIYKRNEYEENDDDYEIMSGPEAEEVNN